MTTELETLLAATPIVPLVQADDPETAVATSKALAEGGLPVVEVVLRTDRALDCLRAIVAEVPQLNVGAGTVLTTPQASAALAAGAKFIVSPGLDDGVVSVAQQHGAPIFPGVYTPTEVQRAHNLGLSIVKFFPASIAGGVPALKALSAVFRTMRFMPTGGISAKNLADYLAVPAVVACGGSWLTPSDAVASGDFEKVTTLAHQATAIASAVRRAK